MGYNYEYEFEQILEQSEVLMIVAGVFAIVALVIAVFGIVMYVFQSAGIYTVAKRRGLKNPWLAWLPVANYWIVGSISDQYRYVVHGEVKSRRILLLALAIGSMVLSGISTAAMGNSFVSLIESGMTENYDGLRQAVSTTQISSFVSLLQSVLNIVQLVFWHMTLFDLYSSCDPKNNVLFLVLGIIFGVTIPFFIFFSRKKDLGMPPRRPEPEQPVWQPHEPPQEPWENV